MEPTPAIDDQSIRQLLPSLCTGSGKDRASELEKVASVFDPAKRKAPLPMLKSETHHLVLETLFTFAVHERQAHFTSKAKNRSPAALSKCAKTVRHVTAHGIRTLRKKTMIAVVAHITQILSIPNQDGRLFEPMAHDYLLTLDCIFSDQFIAEKLYIPPPPEDQVSEWEVAVDFCIDHILAMTEMGVERGTTPVPTLSTNGTGSTASSRISTINSQPRPKIANMSHFQILLRCLWNLVRLRNAPIAKRAIDIASCALQVLQLRSMSLSQAQLLAFYIMNRLMVVMQADAMALVNGWMTSLVPLITHWWQGERVSYRDFLLCSLRDEILKTIYIGHLNIDHLLLHFGRTNTVLLTDLERLSAVLWSEYSRRSQDARLLLEDVNFAMDKFSDFSMKTAHFGLRPHHIEGERQWANLECMAIIEGILLRAEARKKDFSIDFDPELPRKRRRIEKDVSQIQQRLRLADDNSQMTALQMLPFLASQGLLPVREIHDLTALTISLMSHKQGVIASWAMVACASCVLELNISSEPDKALLLQAWHIAARSVSLPSVSRAACVLLSAALDAGLSYQEVSEDLNNIVTQNGPSILADSSVGLMTNLFHLRNIRLPGASQSTCNHIIRWVFALWKPDDFVFSSQTTLIPFIGLVNLLGACCGQPPIDRGHGKLPIGSVGSTRHAQLEKQSLLRYLLLLERGNKKSPAAQKVTLQTDSGSMAGVDSSGHLISKKLVIELFWPKLQDLEQICDSWVGPHPNSSQQFSAERLDSILFTCLAAALMAPQLSAHKSIQSENWGPMVCKIAEISLSTALTLSNDRPTANIVLARAHQSLPSISASSMVQIKEKEQVLCNVLEIVYTALDNMSYGQKVAGQDGIDDDDWFSQRGNAASISGGVAKNTALFPRSRMDGGVTCEAFNLSMVMHLYLIGALGADGGPVEHVPDVFVSKMMDDKSSENVLYRQELIFEVLRSDMVLDPNLVGGILYRLVAVIQDVHYEGSEYALLCCLEAMSILKGLWVNGGGDLGKITMQLYLHFTEKLLSRNMLTPPTQCLLADVILGVMGLNAQYATQIDRPHPLPLSPRTFLLYILKNGPIQVKFFVGHRIAEIFDLYVLKVHDDVFVDILDNLPTNSAEIEGMALRLLVLSNLACRWSTLLRRSTYHIFEIPGRTGSFAEYASVCVSDISTALSLESPQKLFDLFAPQLLYTWLEKDSLQSIPYSIFGFKSLADLLRSSQAEALALMVMRGQEENIDRLVTILGEPRQVLVQHNLARIVAYSVACDESVHESAKTHGDDWARRQMPREVYMETVYKNFVDIVAIFFSNVDQEEEMERYFSKSQSLDYAHEAMVTMKELAHSPVILPPTQQPMFRAKYLINQLLYMCNKTEFEFNRLWRPPLVVAVARRLLNTVHPALGSLHAWSVLRKIRILISFAGDAAWTGYPLQMFLHCLRPFMLNAESADDAMGINQYLLLRGQDQLRADPSFTAGYSLSTLASLRVFLESSQSSTTQESLFQATMSKAKAFHTWFDSWLGKYDSPVFAEDEATKNAFEAITQSAARIRSSGNSEQGTAESDLLLHILRDGDREKPLLNNAARALALDMLCGDFQQPSDTERDIIQTDEDAIGHASLVLDSCNGEALSESYLSWAGRVVGRSFAASGDVPAKLLRESRLGEYLKIASGSNGAEKSIFHLLGVLTGHKHSSTASMAESALRYIISTCTAKQDATLLEAGMAALPSQLVVASDWTRFTIIPTLDVPSPPGILDEGVFAPERIFESNWLPNLTIYLLDSVVDSTLLSVLSPLVATVEGFASDIFPFAAHLVLQAHAGINIEIRQKLGVAMKGWFLVTDTAPQEHIGLLINTILYLRSQPYPGEKSIADRSGWLDIDYNAATKAASSCGMYKIALLFSEIAFHVSTANSSRSSRRSSIMPKLDVADSADALLEIFENIDDPDAYYGLPEDSSLSGVLARLEHENNAKGLVFRGTQLNSHMRLRDPLVGRDMRSMVKSLGTMALAGVSHSLLQSRQDQDGADGSIDDTFQAARKLEIWNLPAPPSTDKPTVTIYRTYQTLSRASDVATIQETIHNGLGQTIKRLTSGNLNAASIRDQLGALAVLTELDEVVRASGSDSLDGVCSKFERRNQWMCRGRYEDVDRLLSCRETSLTMLAKQPVLLTHTRLSVAETKKVKVKAMLQSSGVYRFHEASQESLNIATSLNDLIAPCKDLGLKIDAAVKMEVANSLWDHKEMMPSILMLQGINDDQSASKQAIPVDNAAVLSKIGHRVSVARLETPDEIHRNWLAPALKALKGQHSGNRAGQVFHQFAAFCDQQLQNPDSIEDLARLEKLRMAKLDEVKSLELAFQKIKFRSTQEANHWRASHIGRAESWFKLDDEEVNRVHQSRIEFMRLCLENYLLSLAASDEHNHDALRFTSLWIERSGEDFANAAVRKHIEGVPTRKFATIMNQLSSRLQNRDTDFQKTLLALVLRICIDHPFHGMYQIWTGTKTKVVQQDEVSVLRHEAMERVARRLLRAGGHTAETWTAIDRTSIKYIQLAAEPAPQDSKTRRLKVNINQSKAFQILAAGINKYKIPPPTMQIEVRADKDYSKVPRMAHLESTFAYAGGVSAPKIVTAIGTDGQRYKQLVKGSKNDDLRQDAIMEQVFGQVSALLKLHRKTQQRRLTIRTYKVLPLTATAGLIEFVPGTIPLHEWLMPAHERYHPKDLRQNECRKQISDVDRLGVDARLRAFRAVTAKFSPTMRYFFLEHYSDPDDWFVKRTAYTRTTAAISMLGYILGVGDRHGHNILLDAKSGEVVHIDLGISFEMGRVLPIPELVPFRLTRDIVDGMGITGTEGVFRRCCEFTLAALRAEAEPIMSILDVLRYDPLYQWSISPARMQRLQDARRAEENAGVGVVQDATENRPVRKGRGPQPSIVGAVGVSAIAAASSMAGVPGTMAEDGGAGDATEADRALEVVKRKLTQTLSVEASVYDLINQARDERNLALLFSGWAAYA